MIVSSKENQQREQEAQIRHVESIVSRPLNRIRVQFSEAFLSPRAKENLSIEKLEDLFNELEELFDTNEKKEIFATHRENFEHFIKTGDIKKPLTLDGEESMLFWGMVLGYYATHREIGNTWDAKHRTGKISQTTIWKRIEKSSYMQKELKKHAYIISVAEANKKTKIVYSEHGYPNISYCFIPSENIIVDDMLWTLVCGTDASATAINHEIAHSKGTQTLQTPKMEVIDKRVKELQEQMRDLAKKNAKDEWLKVAKEAARLQAEYQYRFRFLDELENMYANRRAVNVGGDYDKAHLNELETIINVGEKFLSPRKISDFKQEISQSAQARIAHVKAIARNSFFANNELVINHSYQDWHRINLFPELLDGVDSDGVKMTADESFDEIRRICDEFEASQPSNSLRTINEGLYEKRMTRLSQKRAKMADEFFDKFVAHHMEEIYKEAEKSVERMLDQAEQQRQNGSSTPQSGGEQGERGSSNQSSGSNQGQNPQEGKEGDSHNPDNQEEQSQDQEGDDSQNQGNNGNKDDTTQEEQENGEGSSKGEKQEQEQEQENKSGTGNGNEQELETEDGYPSASTFDTTPNEKSKEFTEEEIKDILEKAEEIRELAEEAKREMTKEELGDRGENSDSQDTNDSEPSSEGVDDFSDFMPKRTEPILIDITQMQNPNRESSEYVRKLLEGSYDDYQKYVAQYKEPIASAKRIITEIIKQKKRDSIRRGHAHSKTLKTVLPIQGATTLDKERHKRLLEKIQKRDPKITKKDLQRFDTEISVSEDEVIKETIIEESNFCILIDGSGSMCGGPFDNALATACILYEAVKSIKEVNVYIYMMGAPTPYTIAKPGMSTKEIAENISAAKRSDGTGCNDHLSPAIKRCLEDVAENLGKKPNKTSGFTHIFSITDGGNNDYRNKDVNGYIRNILENNPDITFDSFFIDHGWDNYTRPLIDEMKSKGSTQIDYVNNVFGGTTAEGIKETVSKKIIEMLQKRLKFSEVKEKTTNRVKKKLIEDVLEM